MDARPVPGENRMSFLYFAYGSNMLPARLTARCPSAQFHGIASASNHKLEFSKPSNDGSSKATLIHTGNEPIQTPGIIFEIAKADLKHLDKAEGARYGYDREENFQISEVATGKTLTVTTYLASKKNDELRPYDWYLALVLAGARHHTLDTEHQKQLHEIAYNIDTDHKRPSRTDALDALAAHGHHDHMSLLKR